MKANIVGLIPKTVVFSFRHASLLLACMFCTSFIPQHGLASTEDWPLESFSEETMTWEIGDLNAESEALSCKQAVQVSLNQEGWALVPPGMLVNTPAFPLSEYSVDIMGPLVDTVSCDEAGSVLMAVVTEHPTGNNCMSELLVQDKLDPVLICTPDTVACSVDISSLDFLSFIDSVGDNCDPDPSVTYAYWVTPLDCDPDGFAGIVQVEYTAVDEYGNSSTCESTIYLEKFPLDSVDFPADTIISCLFCDVDPEIIGGPTIDGNPIHHFCELIAWHTDNTVPMCNGQMKVIRLWDVMDWCTGETVSQMQEILVIDDMPPLLNCPFPDTVNTDPGECSTTYTIPDFDVSDVCSEDSLITITVKVNSVPGIWFPGQLLELQFGTHTFTVTAKDDCGNSAQCQFLVTVVDNEPPVLVCTGLNTTLGPDGTVVLIADSITSFTYYDNCGIDEVLIRRMDDFCGMPEDLQFGPSVTFCCDDVGEVVLYIFKVIDVNGNETICMDTIVVTDKTPPEVICPPDVIIDCDESTDPSNTGMATAMDNCPGNVIFTFTDTPSGGICMGEETIIRTWIASDEDGNVSTCTQVITILDMTPPVISCPPDAIVECDQSTAPASTGTATATDNCDNAPSISFVDSESPGSCVQEVIITRTWTATDDCGNSSSCTQTISVVDSTPPTITCPADVTLECDQMSDPNMTGVATADDNCDEAVPDITFNDVMESGSCPFEGTITRTWIATDSCGNSSSCTQTIIIDDTTPPVMICPDDTTVLCSISNLPAYTVLTDFLASEGVANDNCGLDSLSFALSTETSDGNACPETITRVYEIADLCANVSTCVQTIQVTDTVSPVLNCPGDLPAVCSVNEQPAYGTLADLINAGGVASDDCGLDTMSFILISAVSDNNTCPEVVTRLYLIEDLCDNPSTCIQRITIDDNIVPAFECPPASTAVCDINEQPAFTALTDLIDAGGTASDNCGLDSMTFNLINEVSDNNTCPEVVTRTYQISDLCGNQSICTQVITIDDNIVPSLTCPPGQDAVCSIAEKPAYTTVLEFTGAGGSASDNCDLDSMTFNLVSEISDNNTCPEVVTRTYEIFDICDNQTTCVQVITVDDNIDPQLTCPGTLSAVCSITEQLAYANVNEMIGAGGTASDNCGVNLMSFILLSEVSDNNSCPEIVTRTYQIADLCGNMNTCQQNITIDDDIPPALTCPQDLSTVCALSEQPVYLDLTEFTGAGGTATDNCGLDSMSFALLSETIGSGNCPNTVTRTYQIADLCGNVATCQQNLTINDPIPPSLSCPAALNAVCDISEQGPYSSLLELVNSGGTASDNCGLDSSSFILLSQVSDNASCPETVIRTYQVSDFCGNPATCQQIIVIDDVIPPVATCPPGLISACSIDGQPAYANLQDFVVAGGTASDNCGLDSVSFSLISETSNQGTCPMIFTRVYSITDLCGNPATCMQMITVTDDLPPVLTCPADITISCDISNQPPYNSLEALIIGGGSANDNCSIDSMSFALVIETSDMGSCPETFSRTYSVSDECGNLGTCIQLVVIIDTIPPVITCPVDITIDCDASTDPNNTGTATATDNCDDAVTNIDFTDVNNGICNGIVRTWTATDSCGNSTSCQQVITFVDNAPPTFTCPANVELPCGSATDPANTGQPTNVADNCDNAPIVTFADISTQGDCLQDSTISRTWTVTDICGNVATCVQLISLLDTVPPALICPPDTMLAANGMNCQATYVIPNFTNVSDNCADNADLTFEITISGVVGTFMPGNMVVLDTGMYVVTVTVTDPCGNASTCFYSITVEDLSELMAICQNITVFLNANGTVSIIAAQIDNGSSGGCSAGDLTLMLDITNFDCDDIGTNTVVLTVTDELGNVSMCTATVTVVDNLPPVISCPPDTILDCATVTFPLDLTQFGVATATDNCPMSSSAGDLVITEEAPQFMLDNCGVGTIFRAFVATDGSGNSAQCTQIITIDNPDPLDIGDIVPPAPVVNLPECSVVPFTPPVINNDGCAVISISSADSTILTNDNDPTTPCLVVFRTWTVIDSCQLDPGTNSGIFIFIQEISLNDSIGPTFTPIADITVDADPATCDAIVPLVTNAVDCGQNISVTNDLNDGGAVATDTFPIGTTVVTFTSVDACGNVSTMSVSVTVLDPQDPVFQCEKLIFLMTPDLEITVTAMEFVTILVGNCSDPNDFFYSFDNVDPFDSLRTFDCGDVGSVIPLDIFIYTMALMKIDSCLADFDFRDPENFCGPVVLGGEVFSEFGVVIEEVTVNISSDTMPPETTALDGSYMFTGIMPGSSYSIMPERDINPKEGVSTLDLVHIQKHLLGIQSLESPYQLVAADANRSGQVSASDLLDIRKLLLGLQTHFTNNTSWRFIDAKYVFPNAFDPFMEEFPEYIHFEFITSAAYDANFVGIKVGDVNGSYFNQVATNQVETRSNVNLAFEITDMEITAGKPVVIPVVTHGFDNVSGFQFAIALRDKGYTNLEVIPVHQFLGKEHFGVLHLESPIITSSWNDVSGKTILDQTELFHIKLVPDRSGKLSDILSLTDYLKAEAYLDEEADVKIPLNLRFLTPEDNQADYALMQNVPNPFDNTTRIGFTMAKSENITFTLFDQNGREVKRIERDVTSGYHEIVVSKSDLNGSGVYYYTLSSPDFTATRKMLLTE